MKKISSLFIGLAMTMALSGTLSAFQHHSEKALWIETKEDGKLKSTLAVTENIAWMVVRSKHTKIDFSKKGNHNVITKKMLKAVLDGDENSITAKDPDRDQEVTIYAKNLDVPGEQGGNSRLVLETYKGGKKTFRIALPDIEVESKNDVDSDDLVTHGFGWKALLPFLSKSGGALYVKEEKDDSEMWLYVE
jgi:hypothetical protein